MKDPSATRRYWLLRLLEALALLWTTLRIAYHGALFFIGGIIMLFGEISSPSIVLIGIAAFALTNVGVMVLPAKPRRICVIAATTILLVTFDLMLVSQAFEAPLKGTLMILGDFAITLFFLVALIRSPLPLPGIPTYRS